MFNSRPRRGQGHRDFQDTYSFQNAFCTISAMNATSVCFSFLDTTNLYPGSYILPLPLPHGSIGRLSAQTERPYNESEEPPNQRAWTLVERYLSPRLLDYTTKHLARKCWSKTCCFDIHNRIYFNSFPPLLGQDLDPILNLPKYTGYEIPTASLWPKVIQGYSRRKLTYEEDRLPAITGLAVEFQRHVGGNYLAGLWRPFLLEGLLWQACAVGTSAELWISPTVEEEVHDRPPKE